MGGFFCDELIQDLNALLAGTMHARDLVNEPSNILFPKEYSKRISKLKKYGLKIEVFGFRFIWKHY